MRSLCFTFCYEENNMKKLFAWLAIAMTALTLSGCGYNEFQAKDEATKAAWGEVVNQYQRRADLIPNLVNTVKGYASHEKDTLEAVTRARAASAVAVVSTVKITLPSAILSPTATFKATTVPATVLGISIAALSDSKVIIS